VARIAWNAVGERRFETGVDRGVLYVENEDGVPWNGLTSVSEDPDGGEATPYYIDGVKYLNHMSQEDFKATINAYTYPDEFGVCEGTAPVGNGLFVTQQTRKSFGLSYRTMVGNDVEGVDHAYKIHLIYNAMAETSDREHESLSDDVEAAEFSWNLVTTPPTFTGYRPTAHFVIDSREVPSDLLTSIEDILYGSQGETARLPSVPELLFLFEEYQASVFDAGTLVEEYFQTFDAGVVPELYTDLIDGGGA
jgi:hypothetical protein